MFKFINNLKELNATFNALDKSQSMMELRMNGHIASANENFLNLLGYGFEEIKDKHFSLFADANYIKSPEYKQLWENLKHGDFQSAECKCRTKDGREIWVQINYHPIMEGQKVTKVIGVASDSTEQHKLLDEIEELRVRASITNMTSIVSEADLKGDIVTINEKFCEVSKYSRDELIGKGHNTTRHPDMPKEVFKELWSTIGRGKPFRGIIKNMAKDGTPYYVDAVIAPVMGDNGKPKKYIGVRYDITEAEIERQNMKGILGAIDSSYCYAEYDTKGQILTANSNFLELFGYKMEEILGKSNSLFVDSTQAKSDAHTQLWNDLNAGKGRNDVFKRITKDGREVWLQTVYAAAKDEMGRVQKIVEIALDITASNLRNVDYAGQIAAIGKSQAVIEFTPEGIILNANDNFLNVLGYTLDEIKGKHHSMFCDSKYRSSNEYIQFWANLNRGEYQAGEFKRFGKGSKEIWIQASYNPIFDLNGKVYKVVKYASDITQMVLTRTENELGMNEAVKVLTEMSGGNLTMRMDGDYQGTFADIKKAVNATVDKLIDTVVRIKESSESVGSAASEIASGSSDLSMRTEQQASSLEETAASMEEITGTVKQNSANAATANDLSTNASNIASEGGKVVEEAVGAMRNIEKSSQKISDIIGVIDEIAFQTNLLALNAAVEAARAGDAGKGFAVVASEVRALAGRSASASKEIKTLINESAGQVKTGASLVNQAGDTLKGIVGSVKQVAGIVSEIASASVQQATGIDEINSAVTQMDETTQQNAALVEQNTAAAQSMLEQARNLEQLIGFFRVDTAEREAVQPVKPSAPKPAPARPAARPIIVPSAVKRQVTPAMMNKASSHQDGWEEF